MKLRFRIWIKLLKRLDASDIPKKLGRQLDQQKPFPECGRAIRKQIEHMRILKKIKNRTCFRPLIRGEGCSIYQSCDINNFFLSKKGKTDELGKTNGLNMQTDTHAEVTGSRPSLGISAANVYSA